MTVRHTHKISLKSKIASEVPMRAILCLCNYVGEERTHARFVATLLRTDLVSCARCDAEEGAETKQPDKQG